MIEDTERRTLSKIWWRIMPLLMFGSAMAYIDRVNIGFAALTMNRDLGLTAAAYGVASGVFFVTYALCEIPSNAIMARVGARRWLARIMITWGLASAAMALVVGFKSLVAMRLLLGMAEAGFTPGVFWLMTFWFPRRHRGRAMAAFLSAQVIGVIFGASVSGPLLALDHFGLAGWQWMFILQGLPTAVGGVILWRTFADSPAQARWLTDDEKRWLAGELEGERESAASHGGASAWLQAVAHPRVLVLALIYFLVATGALALTFFMPQILRETGLSLNMTGLASAFVWVTAAVGTIACGWWVDRTRHPERVVATACLLLAAGFLAMALLGQSLLLIPMMCLVAIGGRAAVSAFWAIPTGFVHPAVLGLVIAFISSIGNLGGLVGPAVFGFVREQTGAFATGAMLASVLGVVSAVLILLNGRFGAAPAPGGTLEPSARDAR